MSRQVYISETNCITPLGFDVAQNVAGIIAGKSGISLQHNHYLLQPYYAATIDDLLLDTAFSKISTSQEFSKLEKMLLLALQPLIAKSGSALNKRTAFILSTTKGNITALEYGDLANAQLYNLAKTIADFFGFETTPLTVSNACVSGIMAVSVAKRMIQAGVYDDAFIASGDLVSEFVLSGFNSFQAMSDVPCKPYSKNRNGVTLGEAAAAVYITTDKKNAKVEILGDASVNDANHISGPSRTGEGLFLSVESALHEAGIFPHQIDHISAHGTATPFNDEMEAVAFNRLGLQAVPLNSLKGYYGHTLGASGLLETVIGIAAITQGKLFASQGFDEPGISQPLNVITRHTDKNSVYFLKTASGFGGSNTAVVFKNNIDH